jgi:hypothetical protein
MAWGRRDWVPRDNLKHGSLPGLFGLPSSGRPPGPASGDGGPEAGRLPWRRGRVVRQGSAKPRTAVQFRAPPRYAPSRALAAPRRGCTGLHGDVRSTLTTGAGPGLYSPLSPQGSQGRIAQGESASLTRKRSEVQILVRPQVDPQVRAHLSPPSHTTALPLGRLQAVPQLGRPAPERRSSGAPGRRTGARIAPP